MANDSKEDGERGGNQTRNVVVSEFVSLDGVMEDPTWTFQFDRGDDGDQFKDDELRASDALLLGRVTYQEFAEAWPSREGEFADKFNTMPKYVVSTTLEEPLAWTNSTLIKENVADEVATLKQQQGGDILVNGSRQLVQTLMAHDLVDEYRLMTFPIVLGSGKRLFGDTSETTLELVDTQTVGSGVVILTYQPSGENTEE